MEKCGQGRGSLKPERLTRAAAREAEASTSGLLDEGVDNAAIEGERFFRQYVIQ